jgi:hypothetical protein
MVFAPAALAMTPDYRCRRGCMVEGATGVRGGVAVLTARLFTGASSLREVAGMVQIVAYVANLAWALPAAPPG